VGKNSRSVKQRSTKSNRKKPINRPNSKKTKKKTTSIKKSKQNLVFHNKKLFYGGLALIAVIMIITIFYFVGVQPHFAGDDELFIDVNPLEYSLTILDNETASVNFEVQVRHPFSCKPECVFLMKD